MSKPSTALGLEAEFGEFRGKADFNRCTERLGGGEPATTLGVEVDASRGVEVSGCVPGASVCSTLPDVSWTSLSSMARASLGEGALRAFTNACSGVVPGLVRADCLGRGLILGGIVSVVSYQLIKALTICLVVHFLYYTFCAS